MGWIWGLTATGGVLMGLYLFYVLLRPEKF
ncbi:K(+)-transporting ATPase subunit F [Thermobaculum terrenum]|nr:K(+)-transporting ATPase subunit F [Thermobaculum terrenum]